jgi:putative membrane protein
MICCPLLETVCLSGWEKPRTAGAFFEREAVMKKGTWVIVALFAGALSLGLLGLVTAADEKEKPLPDDQFVDKASAAGLAEVNLANIALKKASSPDVRQFAQQMIDDHTRANRELLALADKKKLAMAQKMDPPHEMLAEKLLRTEGADLDREYMKSQLADHQEAVALFERESKNGNDGDLKEWAGKTLPTLKRHLEMARAWNDKNSKKDK